MYFYFCLRLNGMCLSDFFCCSHLHIQAMEENGHKNNLCWNRFSKKPPKFERYIHPTVLCWMVHPSV